MRFLTKYHITMMNFRSRCWLALAAAFVFMCTPAARGQFQNTILHGLDKDHYSVTESVQNHANTVTAQTIQRASLDVHVMETDASGSVVLENIIQTSDHERVFHIGHSLTGGYVLCGVKSFNDGLDRGWIAELDASFNLINQTVFQNATMPGHTPALHISAAISDPTQGYIVTGFAAQGYANGAPKQAWAIKLDLALNIQWQRYLDANPGGPQDWDMASHGIEVPGTGYFVGGSSTGNPVNNFHDQVVMAAMYDYNGNLMWLNAVEDNPHASIGHYSVGADALYDANTNEVYQLANYSIIHHFGVNVWDVATGALIGPKTFEVFSSLGYANIAGFRIMDSQNASSYVVAGYIRNATYSDGTNSFDGSFPFAVEFDRNAPVVIWDEMYPVPSSNYFIWSSIYDAFSAGQQARIAYPKMARINSTGNGYTLVAPHLDGMPFETELFEIDNMGLNPCLYTDLALTPQALTPYFHGIHDINMDMVQFDPGFSPDGITSVDNPCSEPGPCQPNPNFTITDIGNCCFVFNAFPATADQSFCSQWTIDGVLQASGVTSLTWCFTAPGTHQVCYTACCVQADGTIQTQTQCQLVQTNCGGSCVPGGQFLIQHIGMCCYDFIDVSVDAPVDGCQKWEIYDSAGNLATWTDAPSFTWCFGVSGTYLVCFTDCCINADGTINTVTNCQELVVDCGCDPSVAISVQENGCSWTFTIDYTGTGDPSTVCVWTDLFGVVPVGYTWTQDFAGYCGPYGVCYQPYCCNDQPGAVPALCVDYWVDCCEPCTPDPAFGVQEIGDCCYVFTDLTPEPTAAATSCSQWEITDVMGNLIASGAGETFTFCFPGSGTYTICHTDCCVNDDGTINTLTVCQIIEVSCGQPCMPDPTFSVTDMGNCCYQFTDLTPEFSAALAQCGRWDITDVSGNLLATGFGENFTFCFPVSGTYTICHTDCCVNSDGSISTLTVCQTIDVNCGQPCVVNPNFTITDIGNCCYVFDDPTPDGGPMAFPCNQWVITDAFGNQIAVGAGDNFTFCFPASGSYLICNTDCCVNADGTINQQTICQDLYVDCGQPCVVDPTFEILDLGNCCYGFVDLTPDMLTAATICNDWIITDAFGNVVAAGVADNFNWCFTTSGTYTICHTDCCVNPDGTINQQTSCQTITVNCGGPCDADPLFEVTALDNCCYTFQDLTPDPATAGMINCNYWTISDQFGAEIANAYGEIFTYCFGQSGSYTICHYDCCIDANGVINQFVHCQQIDVECGCAPVDFTWAILYNENCEIGACIAPGPDPSQYCALWNWGDGTSEWYPVDVCPTHEYACPGGTYTVCVSLYCCDVASLTPTSTAAITYCMDVTVDCCKLPSAAFIVASGDACDYTFSLGSTDDYCGNLCIDWSFGDGTTGTGWSATHTYADNGVYTVCATIYCCNDPNLAIVVCTEVIVTNCGCDPVDFTWSILYNENCEIGACIAPGPDPSQYCALWNWGDGTSEWYPVDVCPTHEYACPGGTYTVCVSLYCCDVTSLTPTTTSAITHCMDVTVDCCKLPSAAFVAVSNVGCDYTFGLGSTDDFCGNICVDWDFGDGTTSSGWTVSHTYTVNGVYTVCANIYCCNNPNEVMQVCTTIVVNCGCCYPADFSYSSQDCGVCVTPVFATDCANPATIFFDYGDGTGLTSDLCHTYSAGGTYLVCMYAECPGELPIGIGCHEVYVNCCCIPNADFTWEVNAADCCVTFTDLTPDGNLYGCESWVFDLFISQLAGDVVTYCFPGPGTYHICHYDCCVDANGNVNYHESCIDITINCGTPCVDPNQIDPTAICTQEYEPVCGCNGVTYPNACYAYYYGGVTSWTAGPCDATCCLPDGIAANSVDSCCYSFDALYATGCLVTGIDYVWDFGDGSFSTLANPTHCYATNGVYQVCLTATCPDGTAVVYCTTVYANCQPCPQDCEVFAAFNQTIVQKTAVFDDNSKAGPGTTITSWFWTFGDGTSSTDQNPVHTFPTTGDYEVCLTVTGVNADGTTCTDTYCYVVVIPCVGDLNGDGLINVSDVLILLAVYNTACP